MPKAERHRIDTQIDSILYNEKLRDLDGDERAMDSEVSGEERMELMKAYQGLRRSLTRINALHTDVHTYNFIGEGEFRTKIDDETETIRIEKSIPRGRNGAYDTRILYISPKGNVKYFSRPADHRVREEDGLIGSNSTFNKDFTINRVLYITNLICGAVDNHEHRPDALKQKARDIRKKLMAYFEMQDIVPRADLVPLEKILPEIHNPQNEQTHQYANVGHTYENVQIGNTRDRWSVQFDIDDPQLKARAKDSYLHRHSKRIKEHGTGITLDRSYQSNNQLMTETLTVWENGDTEYMLLDEQGTLINYGTTDSCTGYDDTQAHITNPHLPLISLMELEEALPENPNTKSASKKEAKALNLKIPSLVTRVFKSK